MKYELNGFIWYIGYNKSKNFWYANSEERNFQGKTKEEVISKINQWYDDFFVNDEWLDKYCMT